MTWLDGFERIPGNSSGTWKADDEDAPKIVGHTTEGGSIESALGAYRKNNSWPHVTVDPAKRRRVQHVSLDLPARALRNTSTPGETNREARVFQIEIVGSAAKMRDLPDDQADWLGREVFGPMARATGTPLVCTVEFFDQTSGFTLARADARQRLSRSQWDTYSGILGHQHVPENTHWDPGMLPIVRILAAASGHQPAPPTSTPGGFLMALTDEQQERALDLLEAGDLRMQALEQRLARLEDAHNTGPNSDGKDPYPVRLIQSNTRIEAHLGTSPDAA